MLPDRIAFIGYACRFSFGWQEPGGGEAAIEAARLAKLSGSPIKLVWSREEEFGHAYCRPCGIIEVNASATKDGQDRCLGLP